MVDAEDITIVTSLVGGVGGAIAGGIGGYEIVQGITTTSTLADIVGVAAGGFVGYKVGPYAAIGAFAAGALVLAVPLKLLGLPSEALRSYSQRKSLDDIQKDYAREDQFKSVDCALKETLSEQHYRALIAAGRNYDHPVYPYASSHGEIYLRRCKDEDITIESINDFGITAKSLSWLQKRRGKAIGRKYNAALTDAEEYGKTVFKYVLTSGTIDDFNDGCHGVTAAEKEFLAYLAK